MYEIMLNDSLWLDSYQSDILQQDTWKSWNLIADEKNTGGQVTSCCRHEDLEDDLTSPSRTIFLSYPDYIDATMNVVDLLPAPEFVKGTQSVVALQTNLLIARAATVMEGGSSISKVLE